MEPIINPWFIYICGQIDTWRIVTGVAGIVIMAIAIAGLVVWFEENSMGGKLVNLIATPLAIVTISLALLMPNRDTLIAMYVAKHLTPNNIAVVKDETKNGVRWIVREIFNEIENQKINKNISR